MSDDLGLLVNIHSLKPKICSSAENTRPRRERLGDLENFKKLWKIHGEYFQEEINKTYEFLQEEKFCGM